MKDDAKTAGELIRRARQGLGLTQNDVAERVGVTASFITKLEKNEALPRSDVLIELADTLFLDHERLLLLSERSKEEKLQQRIRTRGANLRAAYMPREKEKPTGGRTRRRTQDLGPSQSIAERLGREILNSADMKSAFAHLRAILRDSELRVPVLKILELFAKHAKPRR